MAGKYVGGMVRKGQFGVNHSVCHGLEEDRPVHHQAVMAQLFQPGYQQTEQAVPGAASKRARQHLRRIGVLQRSDQLQAQVNYFVVRTLLKS